MPIYAYRCAACGHTKDVLQKLSDPPLSVCPACGAEAFSKQVTAAGFQLKGSGWYVTDFRNGASRPDKAADKAGNDPPADKSGTAREGEAAAQPAPAAPAPAAGDGKAAGSGSDTQKAAPAAPATPPSPSAAS